MRDVVRVVRVVRVVCVVSDVVEGVTGVTVEGVIDVASCAYGFMGPFLLRDKKNHRLLIIKRRSQIIRLQLIIIKEQGRIHGYLSCLWVGRGIDKKD